MSQTVIDSRKKSLSEALINSIGAYPISLVIAITLLPACAGWITTDPIAAGMFITFTYASVSFVRVYVLRRVFEKFGYDDNFLKLAIKMCKRGHDNKSKEWSVNEKNPKTIQH